jgi:maleylpyruvate isomerase
MNDLERDLAGAIRAHRRLADDIADLTDEQARRPSRLPNWSMGHVLTHIARNADGLTRMVEGAARGEEWAQYPGGFEQRATDIEAGSGRSAADLVADVGRSSAELEAAWAASSDETWEGQGLTVVGPAPIRELPFRRWRETVVHHADLGLAFDWHSWPDDYVRLELNVMTMLWNSRRPMGLTGLPAEALGVDDHHRLAWMLGRTTIEGLDPAGLL